MNIKKFLKKKKKSLFTLGEVCTISITVAVLLSLATGFVVYQIRDKSFLKDDALDDIVGTYKKIKSEYYEDLKDTDLADAAIDGMMGYLNEKYSVYMDSQDTESLNEKLKGDYEGIGIQIKKVPGKRSTIDKVYEGTPAADAGLQEGDILKNVNGTEITEETSNESIVSLIKDGSEVNLTIIRDDEERTFKVEKQKVEYPVVEAKTFEKEEKKIGYLYVSSFNENADKQVEKSLTELESKGISSLIIDLRGNTGGYLHSAASMCELFLKKGKVIYSLEGKTTKNTIRDNTKTSRNYDIVVLVDSRTASASEIVAAALKESYGAILVGTKTYGKGKVQNTSTLSDDTMVKYTTAKWFTPSGDSVDSVGIEPGITVKLTAKYAKNPSDETDEQLQKALEVLTSR